MNDCLIPRLRSTFFFYDQEKNNPSSGETPLEDQSLLKVKTALRILQSLTNDNSISASLWYHQLQTQSQYYPILLCIDIYSLLHNLTLIMDYRYHLDNQNKNNKVTIINNNNNNNTNNHLLLDISDITNAYDIGRKFIMAVKVHLDHSKINHDNESTTTASLNAIDSIKQFYETSFNYGNENRLIHLFF